MHLTSLTLQHFRSYTKKTFDFSPDTTLIVGKNTAGKTNILEAIYALATGKSFRAGLQQEMIAWGEELASVTGQLSTDDSLTLMITHGLVLGKPAPTKKYMVNGVSRRQIDFVGHLRAVFFWPEDLDLVTGSPSLRRKYLDSVLVQIDREYRRNLQSYEKGLRQRNRLLGLINEGKAQRSQLLFWDQLLIKAGGYITDKRAAFIHYINHNELSTIHYQLLYDKSVISEHRLEQYKDAEVGAKVTLVGPHRDDFVVTKCQVSSLKYQVKQNMTHDTLTHDTPLELSKYGSRGEQRLGVLWLKLAELSYIEASVGERPMLLLDDIFSELDEEHRKLVIDLVGKQQTILTSAEEEALPKLLRDTAEMIQLG